MWRTHFNLCATSSILYTGNYREIWRDLDPSPAWECQGLLVEADGVAEVKCFKQTMAGDGEMPHFCIGA